MNIYQAAFASLLVIAFFGDVGYFFQSLSASPGQELSRNSYSMISGSEAFGAVVKTAAKVVSKVVKNMAKKQKGHTKNKRPSNREKHQKGDTRRQKDQSRSDGQKGGKGGNRKKGKKSRH